MNVTKYIYVLVAFAAILSGGCAREDMTGDGGTGTATVTIHGIAGARAPGADVLIDENAVDEIELLVFHEGRFHQRSEGYGLVQGDNGYTCSFNVDTYEGDVTFFFIANASDDIMANMPYKHQDIEAVRKQLTTGYTRESLARSTMPMSAVRNYPRGIGDDFTVSGIELFRLGAKVEVVLSDDVLNFRMDMVQVYRANDLAQLVPHAGAVTYDSGKGMDIVSSPSVPEGARARINTYQVECYNSVMEESIYIPESVGPQPLAEATCIVLRGSFEGGEPTYYRLDFQFPPPYDKLGEVLRNAHYKITINNVSRPGTTDPDEIPDIDPLDFSVEILDWEEDEMGAPADYMAVSSHLINLHFYETSTGMVTLKTTLDDYTVRWCDKDGNVIGNGSAGVGGELRGDDFKVTVEDGGATIRATALKDNENGYKYGYILITSGNIEVIVTIRQADRGMRDYIHLFNLTGLFGNIGDEVLQVNMYDPFAAYGRGLKELLKHPDNFGPAGRVPFEGFYISGAPYQLDLTPYLMEIFDVIYIPTTRTDVVDRTEARYLDEWVKQPNKAMVIQSDMGSNTQLLDYMGVHTEPFTIMYTMHYKVSDRAPAIIASGPFGDISGTIAISQPGTAAMINADTHPWITPILERVDPGYENYMIIGLDEEKQVLYCGDYSLYMKKADFGGVMTGDGRVENQYDILLGNIWAWIAEAVLDDFHGDVD